MARELLLLLPVESLSWEKKIHEINEWSRSHLISTTTDVTWRLTHSTTDRPTDVPAGTGTSTSCCNAVLLRVPPDRKLHTSSCNSAKTVCRFCLKFPTHIQNKLKKLVYHFREIHDKNCKITAVQRSTSLPRTCVIETGFKTCNSYSILSMFRIAQYVHQGL